MRLGTHRKEMTINRIRMTNILRKIRDCKKNTKMSNSELAYSEMASSLIINSAKKIQPYFSFSL